MHGVPVIVDCGVEYWRDSLILYPQHRSLRLLKAVAKPCYENYVYNFTTKNLRTDCFIRVFECSIRVYWSLNFVS